jgi:N-acetylmuramoyl-L-alanine amidase
MDSGRVSPSSGAARCLGRALFLVLWAASVEAALAGPQIALDIGHSTAHPGAISARGRAEFFFNRDLAAQISSALDAQQFVVQTINLDGTEDGLESRTAKAAGADFLISVHHDSVQPQYLKGWIFQDQAQRYSDRSSGFSLFVSRRNPDPALSLACASAIGSALRQSGLTPSLHHAEPIEGESRLLADEANGVYYYDELVILRTATQPAVLLEAGVIVHRDEEAVLSRIDQQQRIGRAVTRGLIQCLRPGGKPREKEKSTLHQQDWRVDDGAAWGGRSTHGYSRTESLYRGD